MGLGERGQRRVKVDTPKVEDLFKPTEPPTGKPAVENPRVGRPKGCETVQKTFNLPIDLNRQLRKFAFENECKEVDIVRKALEEYFNAHK